LAMTAAASRGDRVAEERGGPSTKARARKRRGGSPGLSEGTSPPDPRARAELLLSRADRVSREERERDRKEIDVLRAASPEIGAYPLDPPELDRIDLDACPRAADPEAAFERAENRLLALWSAGRLTRDARRTLLTLLIAAGAQRRLLAGRSEAEAVADLAAHGPPLREAGGPIAPDAYGPRVARIFEGVQAR